MTSLDILAPYLTDEIKALAVERIIHGKNLAARKDLARADVKLALLIVRGTNPLEHLSREEKAILMGINRETLTKIEREKRFVHVVNY